MIARDDDNLCLRDRGKQVIDLFQVAQQRLAVEQIPCDEQAVHAQLLCLGDDGGKRIADIAAALPAPRLVAVRGHAPVDVAGMDKFHILSPFQESVTPYVHIEIIIEKGLLQIAESRFQYLRQPHSCLLFTVHSCLRFSGTE